MKKEEKMLRPKTSSEKMETISECMNRLKGEGYTEDFSVQDNMLRAASAEKSFRPAEVTVIATFRFEGESDPGDNSIIYVIETESGIKGLLTDAYGAYADDRVAKFMMHVQKLEDTAGEIH